MITSMSENASAALGGIYVFGFIIGGCLFVWWFTRRFSAGIMRNQRKRQIEAALHRRIYDRQLIDEVAEEQGYDQRDLRR